MSVRIRLSRTGRKGQPSYKLVVANSRARRDGRCIERIGYYNPLFDKDDERWLKVDVERVHHWLGVGAKASDRVIALLKHINVSA